VSKSIGVDGDNSSDEIERVVAKSFDFIGGVTRTWAMGKSVGGKGKNSFKSYRRGWEEIPRCIGGVECDFSDVYQRSFD